jgi:hypothetical protein
VKKSLVFILITSFVLTFTGTALAFPVDFTGHYRLSFDSWRDNITDIDNGTDYANRIQLDFSALLDPDVTLFGRLAVKEYDGYQKYYPYTDLLDNYGVKIAKNGWTYSVGRQGVSLGQGSVIWTGSDIGYDCRFDGLVAAGPLGSVNTQFIIGRTAPSISMAPYTANWMGVDFSVPVSDSLTFGTSYASENASENLFDTGKKGARYLGFNTTFTADKLSIYGECVKSNANDYNKAYFIAASYSWDNDWFSIQYNNVQINAVDRYMSGIGSWMYPTEGTGLDSGNKYTGFTYNYDHMITKNLEFNINFMTLKVDGHDGNDNEWNSSFQWNF